MAERVKSAKEYRREYESLCRQVSAAAADLPRKQREIEDRVRAEMGDPMKKLSDLKELKAAAARAMYEAEERERPQREAEAKAQAEKAAEAERKQRADAVAERLREKDQTLRRRLSEAAR